MSLSGGEVDSSGSITISILLNNCLRPTLHVYPLIGESFSFLA
jgi:hypothetical protein